MFRNALPGSLRIPGQPRGSVSPGRARALIAVVSAGSVSWSHSARTAEPPHVGKHGATWACGSLANAAGQGSQSDHITYHMPYCHMMQLRHTERGLP